MLSASTTPPPPPTPQYTFATRSRSCLHNRPCAVARHFHASTNQNHPHPRNSPTLLLFAPNNWAVIGKNTPSSRRQCPTTPPTPTIHQLTTIVLMNGSAVVLGVAIGNNTHPSSARLPVLATHKTDDCGTGLAAAPVLVGAPSRGVH